MQKEITFDKVSWHTKMEGNPESRDHIIIRFFALVSFLQKHFLTTRVLASNINEITDDFSVKSTDLTEAGFTVMKSAYDKWLRRIDRGADPTDVSILEKELKKITL